MVHVITRDLEAALASHCHSRPSLRGTAGLRVRGHPGQPNSLSTDTRLTGPVVPCSQDLYVAEALSTLESWRSRYNQVVKDKGDLELEIIVLNEYVC